MNIEQKLSLVEWELSKVSAIPVLGTFSGAAKICLGLIQTIVALVSAIVLFPLSCCHAKSRMALKRIAPHILHGMGNILAGSLESIPILGSIIYCIRNVKGTSETEMGYETSLYQRGKFLGYTHLFKNVETNDNQIVKLRFDYTEKWMLKA